MTSEPAILQYPHETKEKGNDHDANEQHNATPEPTTPSWLQHQQPSWQGHVAYVIYGEQGSEAGMYSNWYILSQYFFIVKIHNRKLCIAVIRHYYHNSVPPYLGFNAEEHAQISFAAFQASRLLPVGLFSLTSFQRLNGSPVLMQSLQPLTSHCCSMTPISPFSHTAVNPPLLSTLHTPVRAAPQVQNAFTP